MRPDTFIKNGTTDRLLDVLVTEGWWAPSSQLFARVPGVSTNTLRQCLKRLKAKGWVESRPIGDSAWGEHEHEWRIHPDFEWPE